MTVGNVFWSITEILPGQLSSYWAAVAVSNLSFIGVGLAATSFFVFGLEYSGREQYLTRRVLALLAVEPILVQVALWTNRWHNLFYRDVLPAETFHGLEYVFGPAFWIHALYSYAIIMAAICLLLLMAYRRKALYRTQSIAMAVASIVPLIANILTVSDIVQFNLSLSPPAFTVSGLALMVAILRADLTTVTPVAQSTILDHVRDGVVVLNEHDQILDINPMGKRILQLEGESVVGTHAREALSEYPEVWEYFAAMEQGEEEVDVHTDDGRRSFHVRVSPVGDKRGRHVGRLFVFHDITRQKRRERKLAEQNEKLDQFASLVSHDLRNPLNVSQGHAQIGLEADSKERMRKSFEEISQANDRMQQLIDDVLTLAREGDAVEETTSIELESIAQDAWRNVDTRVATLTVETNLAFEADEDRLLRVFENLFRNALDHGPDDVSLTVGAISQTEPPLDDAADVSGFYIADDGPGIPADERESIFDDGYTTADDGTGLGLSIVESIVDAHEWEITATESHSGGARFEITGIKGTNATETVTR
jgi:PAS domain S-box-containing protein